MRLALALAFLALAFCETAQAAEFSPGKIIAAGIGGAVMGAIFATIYAIWRLVVKWREARQR